MKITIEQIRKYCEALEISTAVYFERHTAFLDTFSGKYLVKYIDSDLWVHTAGNGGFGQSWCCHSGTLIEVD